MANAVPPSLPDHRHPHISDLDATTRDAFRRKYLTLLPHEQLVDVCLRFAAHAPPHVHNELWPEDLEASVSQLNASAPPTTTIPADATPVDLKPSRATPLDPAAAASASTAAQPTASTSANATPAPAPAPPPGPVYPQQVPYGSYAPAVPVMYPSYYGYTSSPHHQPYGSYTAHSGPPYPHVPRPGTAAQVNPRAHPHSFDPAHPNAHLGPDDLPSYEEMIVEALEVCRDPAGSQPKNLFLWMAGQYPLQVNFRPSASQALQKAFKRGRLLKNEAGKYRINPEWDGGGTTTKRARRVQFVPSRLSALASAPANSAAPSSASAPVVFVEPQLATNTGPDAVENDAWEAAQSIIKAINFGGLLAQAQAQAQASEDANAVDHGTPAGPVASTSYAEQDAAVRPVLSSADRAALQSQLVLLSAQLRDIGKMDEEYAKMEEEEEEAEPAGGPAAAIASVAASVWATVSDMGTGTREGVPETNGWHDGLGQKGEVPQGSVDGVGPEDEEDDPDGEGESDDEMEMVEVPVPMPGRTF